MTCETCGRTFEDDEYIIIRENMGEHFGFPAYEEWAACPYCKSTDISEY